MGDTVQIENVRFVYQLISAMIIHLIQVLFNIDSTLESILREIVMEEDIKHDHGRPEAPLSKREMLIEAAVLIQHRQ